MVRRDSHWGTAWSLTGQLGCNITPEYAAEYRRGMAGELARDRFAVYRLHPESGRIELEWNAGSWADDQRGRSVALFASHVCGDDRPSRRLGARRALNTEEQTRGSIPRLFCWAAGVVEFVDVIRLSCSGDRSRRSSVRGIPRC